MADTKQTKGAPATQGAKKTSGANGAAKKSNGARGATRKNTVGGVPVSGMSGTGAEMGTSRGVLRTPDGAPSGQGQLFRPVPVPTRVDYALLEGEIQRWWDEHEMLAKYLRRNDASERRWSFLDGPITANNPMGVHHAWGRTYKDLFQRFHTMLGERQRYQNGFDCQGLWVEVETDKELGIKSKREIEELGMARYVELCKARVLRFADRITAQSIRLGEWMDWSNSYYTMSDENNYTIWGFLKLCAQRGWIYKGHDVMPWCPHCGTGISDMEINEGRKEVQHTSVYVRLPLVDRPNEYLLVWTTTPWTLPANVAAAVNPELTYARVEQDGDVYYLSVEVVPKLTKLRGHEHGEAKVVGTLLGRELLGWRYTGPFDELPAWRESSPPALRATPSPQEGEGAGGVRTHRVVAWDEVSAKEGTGIVHIAPGAGREDFALGKANNLPVLAPLDESGVYLDGYDWLSGANVADVARPIFESLRSKGYFYQTETYQHVYPHCWRCGTELVFRLVDEWFISMGSLDDPGDNLRKRLVRIVEHPGMTWIPSFGRDRELDWLRNMEDWMISKKRYYGLALPIYECEQCGSFEVLGGKQELRERAVAGWEEFEGHSPHRPWVDAVKIRCAKCDAVVSRIADVGNPWLDAGIVPFSTMHYNTDRNYWKQWYPADFITEGFPGQFRNWFYSLLVMSAAIQDQTPFRTVLGYANLLDQTGREFHKSWGNSIEFDKAAEIVGADTMRWLFAAAPPEQDLRFPRIPTEAEAAQAREAGAPPRLSELWMQARSALDKLWNVYSFFVTYANIDGFDPTAHSLPPEERSDLDRWVLSELQRTIGEVTRHLHVFDAEHATAAIGEFVENLSNWYVRRSRRRFWKAEEDADKVGAYLTLYECLVTATKLLAPFTPFLAESLYQNLVRSVSFTAPESVHLCDWPVVNAALESPKLHEETALVMRAVNLGRAAREKAQIRVRQPLAALYVRVSSDGEREALARLQGQVIEELNVKRLELLPPESDMLHYSVQPRMQVLGPKLGKLLPKTLAALRSEASGDMQAKARQLLDTGRLPLSVEGEGRTEEVVLTPEDVTVEASARAGYVAAEERGYVVLLDTTLTPDLVAEGLVRDLTHLIQDVRKHAGLAIEDTIATELWTDGELGAIAERLRGYIADETLSTMLTVKLGAPPENESGWYAETIPGAKLGGHTTVVRVRKAGK
jgi:isoleucyl-tRNA synthetase